MGDPMRAGDASLAARQRGFVLIAWLIAVATFAALATTFVTSLANDLKRDREDELLRIGNEIAGAIASYARASAGTERRHPADLSDLLEDRRAFGTLRHLRRIEPDPFGRGAPWGLLTAADGGIRGVYSRSADAPLRRRPLSLDHVDLPAATRYSQWAFVPRGDGR